MACHCHIVGVIFAVLTVGLGLAALSQPWYHITVTFTDPAGGGDLVSQSLFWWQSYTSTSSGDGSTTESTTYTYSDQDLTQTAATMHASLAIVLAGLVAEVLLFFLLLFGACGKGRFFWGRLILVLFIVAASALFIAGFLILLNINKAFTTDSNNNPAEGICPPAGAIDGNELWCGSFLSDYQDNNATVYTWGPWYGWWLCLICIIFSLITVLFGCLGRKRAADD